MLSKNAPVRRASSEGAILRWVITISGWSAIGRSLIETLSTLTPDERLPGAESRRPSFCASRPAGTTTLIDDLVLPLRVVSAFKWSSML